MSSDDSNTNNEMDWLIKTMGCYFKKMVHKEIQSFLNSEHEKRGISVGDTFFLKELEGQEYHNVRVTGLLSSNAGMIYRTRRCNSPDIMELVESESDRIVTPGKPPLSMEKINSLMKDIGPSHIGSSSSSSSSSPSYQGVLGDRPPSLRPGVLGDRPSTSSYYIPNEEKESSSLNMNYSSNIVPKGMSEQEQLELAIRRSMGQESSSSTDCEERKGEPHIGILEGLQLTRQATPIPDSKWYDDDPMDSIRDKSDDQPEDAEISKSIMDNISKFLQ